MVGAELWCCWSADNSIGDEGARDLGEKLQSNTTITSLDLASQCACACDRGGHQGIVVHRAVMGVGWRLFCAQWCVM